MRVVLGSAAIVSMVSAGACGPAVPDAVDSQGRGQSSAGTDDSTGDASAGVATSDTADSTTGTSPGTGEDAETQGDHLCGNGVLETGEQCDDGNSESDDGCNAACLQSGTLLWSTTGRPDTPVFGTPIGLDLDELGTAYVMVNRILQGVIYYRVVAFDVDGLFQWRLDQPTDLGSPFSARRVGGVAVTYGGSSRVVAAYDAAQAVLWESPLPPHDSAVSVIERGADETVYVMERGGQGDPYRLSRLDASGEYTWSAVRPGEGIDWPERVIAFADGGAAVVIDGQYGHGIHRFDAGGNISWEASNLGSVRQAWVETDEDVLVCAVVSGAGDVVDLVLRYGRDGGVLDSHEFDADESVIGGSSAGVFTFDAETQTVSRRDYQGVALWTQEYEVPGGWMHAATDGVGRVWVVAQHDAGLVELAQFAL